QLRPCPPPLLGAERIGRLAQSLGRLAEVLVDLLVVEQRLRRPLAVRHPPIGALRRAVGAADVLAQLLVLDQLPDVRVRARRLRRVARAVCAASRLGLRAPCHRLHSSSVLPRSGRSLYPRDGSDSGLERLLDPLDVDELEVAALMFGDLA